MTMRRCMGCMNEIDDALEVCPHCGYVRGTAPREAYHLPPESILEGRYIVGRVLGYGGFGVTYIGWDAQLERKVAIKEFLPSTFATRMPGYTAVTVYAGEATEQFEAGLHRFVDEAQRLAKFNGIPGIVDIYDTFVQNNTAYIVMEYLQGQDVKDLLNANGPLPYERARDIVLSVCDTLKPVHAEGIIHRDIAPDNIYITSDGQVKLLDFGASRYATSINSKSLSVILKSGYAPEEQYRSRGDQGPWSDVYALAATFYKMLTGVTPDDSMERAIRDELKEPSRLGAELPKSAENAIMNALQIKKENRTQTAEDFKQQLLADGVERVKVKPPKSDRMPLWQKVLLGGGAAVVLIFALLTVTGVIDLGQGNLLRDTFGSSVPEGYVNAPGIVNMQEEAAKESATKAGLDFLIVGMDYSDRIEKGKILTQEPTPGRLIELGGTMQVRMSGGSAEEAMAAGEDVVPDLTYKTVAEAIEAIWGISSMSWRVNYVYSDDVADGIVVSQEIDPNEGYNYQIVNLYVSAGRDEASNDLGIGDMRGLYLYPHNSGVEMNYAIAALDRNFTGRMIIVGEYSVDGENWYTLKDGRGYPSTAEITSDYMDYDDYDPDVPYDAYHSLFYGLAGGNPYLAGQELQLRLSRYYAQSDEYDAPRRFVDRIDIPARIVMEQTLAAPEVTGYQILEWSEVPEETIERDNNLNHMRDQEWAADYKIVQLEGGFAQGTSYQVDHSYYSDYAHCYEDGVVYVARHFSDDENTDFFSGTVRVRGPAEYVGDDLIAMQASDVGFFNIASSGAAPDASGMTVRDAMSTIIDWVAANPGDNESWDAVLDDIYGSAVTVLPVYAPDIPPGRIAGYQITDVGYAQITIGVSVEQGTVGSQVIPLWENTEYYVYEDSVFANTLLGFVPAYTMDTVSTDNTYLETVLYYSLDGGPWQESWRDGFDVGHEMRPRNFFAMSQYITAEMIGNAREVRGKVEVYTRAEEARSDSGYGESESGGDLGYLQERYDKEISWMSQEEAVKMWDEFRVRYEEIGIDIDGILSSVLYNMGEYMEDVVMEYSYAIADMTNSSQPVAKEELELALLCGYVAERGHPQAAGDALPADDSTPEAPKGPMLLAEAEFDFVRLEDLQP